MRRSSLVMRIVTGPSGANSGCHANSPRARQFNRQCALGIHRRHEPRMGNRVRGNLFVGNDDSEPGLSFTVQELGELIGHAHASVRSRVARKFTCVNRDARPGEALHVGHGRVVVQVRVVIGVLLKDREYARRRFVALLSRGDGRRTDDHAIAIHIGQLLGQRHDHHDRPLGRQFRVPGVFARLQLPRQYRFCRSQGGGVLGRRLGGSSRPEKQTRDRRQDRW